jgi:beta-lactamase class D
MPFLYKKAPRVASCLRDFVAAFSDREDDNVGLMLLIPILLASVAAAPPAPALAPGECVVVAALDGSLDRTFGGDECERRTLPASTFKVPHALIALDTGVMTAKTVIKWDGVRRDYDVWNRDQTLESAIRWSAVWVFQQIARSLGRGREIEHLHSFSYGSQAFTGEVDQFWLNGDLTISPSEQVAFLKKMFTYGLPVERRHVDAVKAAMTMKAGELSNATGVHPFPLGWHGAIARLKTGNGVVGGERVSWIVGEFDSDGRGYVFASRVRTARPSLETTAGADLAVRVLNAIAPSR